MKLADLDEFGARVYLLRKFLGCEVAGFYFTKTAHQKGPAKAAKDWDIEVAVCAQDQPLSAFSLVFHRYDTEKNRRLRHGEARFEEDGIKNTFQDRFDAKLIRADGSVEERGR
jgi:hypothetical protein